MPAQSPAQLPAQLPAQSPARQVALADPSQRLAAIALAATLGLALLFLSGFAPAAMLHNAAHDWRHSHNFPCH